MPGDAAIEAAAAMLAVRDMAEDGDAYRQSPEHLARAVGFIRITNPKHWARCRDTAAAAIRAYLAAQREAGFVMVPVIPTPEMVLAADEAHHLPQDKPDPTRLKRMKGALHAAALAAQPAERTAAEMRREVEE